MRLSKHLHHFVTAAVLAGTVGLSGTGAAFAGNTGTSDNGGGTTDPEPGATVDTSWNPNTFCTVVEGESLKEVLACLASWIDDYFFCRDAGQGGGEGVVIPVPGMKGDAIFPPACPPEPYSRSDYNVVFTPNAVNPTGINIRLKVPDPPVPVNPEDPAANYEPYRLRIRETSHNIKGTYVHVDRDNLLAKINMLEGTPSGGSIEVTINGTPITPITTYPSTNIGTLNQTLLNRIKAVGFSAKILSGNIVIYRHGVDYFPFAIRDITFKSTDNGIYKSQIQLSPSVVDQIEGGSRP